MKLTILKLTAFAMLATASGVVYASIDSESDVSLRGSFLNGEDANLLGLGFMCTSGCKSNGKGGGLEVCESDCRCPEGDCEMFYCEKNCQCRGGKCKMPMCTHYCRCAGGGCDMSSCVSECKGSTAGNAPIKMKSWTKLMLSPKPRVVGRE